jgi:hypothetical protein
MEQPGMLFNNNNKIKQGRSFQGGRGQLSSYIELLLVSELNA